MKVSGAVLALCCLPFCPPVVSAQQDSPHAGQDSTRPPSAEADAEWTDTTRAAVLARGRRLTRLFYEGELASVWEAMTEEARYEPRTLAGLGEFLEEVREVAGEETAILEERLIREDGVRHYLRVASFARFDGPLHVRWSFGPAGQVIGFYVRPPDSAAEEVDYRTKTDLRLPFRGRWYVGAGGRTRELNHHHDDYTNRFAYDFTRTEDARARPEEREVNEDFVAWEQPVLAPGDGVVAAVVDSLPDNPLGKIDREHPMGNHVAIDHGNDEFSVLGHLRAGSVPVAVGDRVRAGQPIGRVGNSGNTTGPHLHYNLQTTPRANRGTGLPAQFQDYCENGRPVGRGEPVRGMVVSPTCQRGNLEAPDTEAHATSRFPSRKAHLLHGG